MFNTYTVISFGNYETKILTCNFVNKKLYPIYKTSFLTDNCLQDSIIIDEEAMIKVLEKEFVKMPIDLSATNVIVNIPIKNLEISTNKMCDVPISKKDVTKNEILELVKLSEKPHSKDKVELDRRNIFWKINGNEVDNIDNLSGIEYISWKYNSYYANRIIIEKFKNILDYFKCKPSLITCDSLVMNHLFENKERKHKVLINIGHLKSSFDKYENGVLVDQKSVDFGIRHLTSAIGKKAYVDEKKAIEILKIYKDLITVNESLALINHFKEKYLDYYQTTIHDINNLIGVWIMQLSNLINIYTKEKEVDVLGVDEIYFYSSMNILDYWFPYIKDALHKRVDIFSVMPKIFSIHEAKYCSLVATVYYFVDKQKMKMIKIN